MSIERSELQAMRDRIRQHNKDLSPSVGRASAKAATALDGLDACLSREGIECLSFGVESTKDDGQEK